MKRFRRSPAVLSRAFSGEALVALPGRDDFESLTGTGYAVWMLLEEPRSLEELTGELAEIYGAEESSIAADLGDFLSSLKEREVIEVAS